MIMKIIFIIIIFIFEYKKDNKISNLEYINKTLNDIRWLISKSLGIPQNYKIENGLDYVHNITDENKKEYIKRYIKNTKIC
jgi:hypothetical protein